MIVVVPVGVTLELVALIFALREASRSSLNAPRLKTLLVSSTQADAVVAAPFRNASRSALIVSASVVGMPCGKLL